MCLQNSLALIPLRNRLWRVRRTLQSNPRGVRICSSKCLTKFVHVPCVSWKLVSDLALRYIVHLHVCMRMSASTRIMSTLCASWKLVSDLALRYILPSQVRVHACV